MKIFQLDKQAAVRNLRSNVDGLSGDEARRRLGEFGPNRVERVQGTPLSLRFVHEFTHFFALMLWIAAALAFVAEWQQPGSGLEMLGYAILGVIAINGVFSFAQEYRAERAMESLLELLPRQVKVMRDGVARQTSAEELVPGDVVLLDDGDLVPADCLLLEAFGVRVNNATLTGESESQIRVAELGASDDELRAPNVVLAGTSIVSGQAKAIVFATGMRTEFGAIARLTQDVRVRSTPLQKEIARLSRLIAALSLALGAAFFFVGDRLGLNVWQSVLFAVGIIVANVPEGLLPTVTLSLAMASQRMAKKNALIRHLPSVETLGAATVICTDKTGTLTENRMAVKRIYLAGRLCEHGPTGFADDLPDSCRSFFEAASLCQTLKQVEIGDRRTFVGDPMEAALVEMAKPLLATAAPVERIDEIPFDTDRKRLSMLHRVRRGLLLSTKGALESILPLCSDSLQEGGTSSLDDRTRADIIEVQELMAAEGLRVLAIAERRLAEPYDRDRLEEQMTFLGLVGLEDPPRPEVPDAIRKCAQAGIKVVMITGDHPQTALAIARQIGLVATNQTPTIVTGDRLRQITSTELQLALGRPDVLFARVGADQKMKIVAALKAQGHIVAVTGDGVNDAPALREAHIGIAMGRSGTDVARQAADMVLLDDNFASIVSAIEEGRAVFANIRKFLTYILTSNVPELVPYLAFVVFKVPLALTVVQILVIDLGTDMLPALGLGAEPPEPGIMDRPPRSARDRLVDWPLLVRAYLFLGPFEAAAAMTAFFVVLCQGGWTWGQALGWDDPIYRQATTACLATVIIMQVVNVFLCRSERSSVFVRNPLRNRWIVIGVGVELLLVWFIAETSAGNALFGTAPIGHRFLVIAIPFAFALFAIEEIRKWIVRTRTLQRTARGDSS